MKYLILGAGGQDGFIASVKLAQGGHKVFAHFRNLSQQSFFLRLFRHDALRSSVFDLENLDLLEMALAEIKPDVVLNFAAKADHRDLFNKPVDVARVNALVPIHVLETIRKLGLQTRFIQASSSLIFGASQEHRIIDEESPRKPQNFYAAAKEMADNAVRISRESFGIWCSSAILFNHESPLRNPRSLSREISIGVAKILLGHEESLRIRNLNISRHWTFAGDVVEGIISLSAKDEPLDTIFASSELHSLERYLEASFSYFDLDWKKYVVYGQETLVPAYSASIERAKKTLSWYPSTTLESLAQLMVIQDLNTMVFSNQNIDWLRGK